MARRKLTLVPHPLCRVRVRVEVRVRVRAKVRVGLRVRARVPVLLVAEEVPLSEVHHFPNRQGSSLQ